MAEPSPERIRRRELLRRSPVYLVTEEAFGAGRSSVEIAEAAMAGGIRIVQVREKDGTARHALEIARALRESTRRCGALLLVNDRLDIALAVGADGAHVGQEDIPIEEARRVLGPDALIGLSITDESQLGAADAAAADYLGVGAVFPSDTKTDATQTGLALLAAARASTPLPIVAIGGVKASNAALAVEAGADSLAVITAITMAPDPAAAARALAEAAVSARMTARAEAARR
jgi:thiamine-phosphate pyrophosphorylase